MAGKSEQNKQWILVSRPTGEVTKEHYKLEENLPIPTPQEGEILIRSKFISVDPYMRVQHSSQGLVEPHPLNTVQGAGVVGEVIESKDTTGKIQRGDFVFCYTGWRLYATCKASEATKLDMEGLPLEYALGILGMPGRTAYFGFLEAGKPVAGETVVVSGAAGAVGSIVVQIAKILGCRVVGIAGSDEKLKYLTEELGADAAINYKKFKTEEMMVAELKRTCPNGVDIYFDNVGGYITDAIFRVINTGARMVICGQISQYNLDNPPLGPRLLSYLVFKKATIQGILTSDVTRLGEMLPAVKDWIKKKKLKYRVTVQHGFENLPSALNSLFHGANVGKLVVQV